MKTIIYNEENLNEKDVTKYSKRVKLLVENSKGEILIIDTKNNAFFIGGHIEGDESDLDCLIREIREVGGVDFIPIMTDPFFEIKYIYKRRHIYLLKTSIDRSEFLGARLPLTIVFNFRKFYSILLLESKL